MKPAYRHNRGTKSRYSIKPCIPNTDVPATKVPVCIGDGGMTGDTDVGFFLRFFGTLGSETRKAQTF